MQTRAKLALLELIGGAFGWGWIAASITALYFFVSALMFSGSWRSFLWAAGAAMLCKWLLRGFTETKSRLASDPCALSDSRLREVQELVSRYGEVMERSPGIIAADAELPADKEQIKDALVALALHARAAGTPREGVEYLRTGYAMLALFVPQRDADAANGFDSLARVGAGELAEPRLLALARQMSNSGPRALEVHHQSNEDMARLASEFDGRVG